MSPEDASDEMIVRTGQHGPYQWLTATGEVYIGTLLELCPDAVLNRYLAVTSCDSGVLSAEDQGMPDDWQSRGGVAYSPLVGSIVSLPFQRDGLDYPGYDEWYVFEEPRELAPLYDGNFFEFQPANGELMVFVNTFAFVLHEPDPYFPGILDFFWNQLIGFQPETFIADGRDCLTLVSKRQELVARFHSLLTARADARA